MPPKNKQFTSATCRSLMMLLAITGFVQPLYAAGLSISLLESLYPGELTRPNAITPDGSTIVGSARNGSGQLFATRWRINQPIEVLMPLTGHITSSSTGVSADGAVVVGISRPQSSSQGVRWSHSLSAQLVQTSSGEPAIDVTGVSFDGTAMVGRTSQDGFLLTNTGTHTLPRLSPWSPSYPHAISSDGTTAVGVGSIGTTASRAFIWSESTGIQNLGILPGFHESLATEISADKSTVIGHLRMANSDRTAFYWRADTGIQLIQPLTGYTSLSANSVTSDGSVIVGNAQAFGGNRAYIWSADLGMRDLNDVFASVLPNGWLLASAYISADGRVLTGLASVGGPHAQAWVGTIPEPCTVILFGTPALVCLMIRRRPVVKTHV